MELATREGFSSDPGLVWRWYVDRREMIGACDPNPGHYAIAELETIYPTFTVITQNIDNLHKRAGSNNIVEVHGNVFKFKCFDQDHPVDELPESLEYDLVAVREVVAGAEVDEPCSTASNASSTVITPSLLRSDLKYSDKMESFQSLENSAMVT